MILVCPSCDTRYFADDSAIGKDGRRVRCASCGHSWLAKPQEEGKPAPEDTGLTREQVERLRQTAAANSASRSGPHAEYRAREHARRQRDRTRATGIAWGAGFVIFAMAIGSAVLLRNQVADAFPRAGALYKLVGLDVNRFGVQLQDVKGKRSFDGTTPVLTVTGVAVNSGKTKRAAPQLQVSLRDEHGKEVKTWTDNLGVETIGPGERVEFSSRFEAPPVETYRLTVTFAREPGEAGADEPGQSVEIEGAAGEGGEGAAHAAGQPYEEPPWTGGDSGGAGEPADAHGEAAQPKAAGEDSHH